VNTTRPTNISLNDLRTIKFPITAITSLLHRITGVVLFLAIPIMLWLLSQTLSENVDYGKFVEQLQTPSAKIINWVIISSLSYHVIAGIRHLFMDLGYGETLEVAKLTSALTLVAAIIVAATWGAWLW
jgi:succinate dehydrogenase / fumarate reductase cytochrome b subunit